MAQLDRVGSKGPAGSSRPENRASGATTERGELPLLPSLPVGGDLQARSGTSERGCSLGIEKHLHEGRAARDQKVEFDAATGITRVEDAKIPQTVFEVGSCPLDVLSALFVVRIRGDYSMGVRWRGRERLDLPPPFGKDYPTVIVEPLLVEGSGLFVREGRLQVWLTDDARRVPVRMRSKVAIGSVSADLDSDTPPLPR